jgi:hypothetical protein
LRQDVKKKNKFTGKSRLSISAYTIKCFDEVKKNPQFRNKWITDVAWIEIIKNECSNIPKDICIKTGSLNNGFSKQHPYKTHDLLKQKVTDATGVYKAKNGSANAYYVTEPNQLPDSLANTDTWRGKWISSLEDLKDNNSSEMIEKKRMPSTTIVSGRKKQRTTRSSLKGDTDEVATHFQQSMNYWNSGECLRVFGIARPSTDDANDDLKQVVQNRIRIIRNAYQQSAGWREVIEDNDSGNLYTEHDTFNLRWTCRYIVEALEIAMEDRGETWEACCKEAVLRVNSLEKFELIKSCRTIQNWHLAFRRNDESFPNKHASKLNVPNLPVLLETYPEAKASMITFMKENLNQLSAELVYTFVHENVLPNLAKLRGKELGKAVGEYKPEHLLKDNGLIKLAIPTIYRWMRKLGFKYMCRKKVYYVDGHERPANKKYRKKFTSEYMRLEKRMHRWIQIEKSKFEELCETHPGLKEGVNSPGYDYSKDGVDYIEFHVDDHNKFQ